MKYRSGEEFLNKMYSKMYLEKTVSNHAQNGSTPTEIIKNYLDRLEEIHNIAKQNDAKLQILKEFYYKKYIIKELPENYIKLQKKILREEGNGSVEITQAIEKEWLKQVRNEQKHSLDTWIDYLISDDAIYPMWFKNYVFRGMITLNKFDKEKMSFGKRSATTTEPFVELNREALANVYDVIKKKIGNNEISTEELLIKGENFKTLYGYFIAQSNAFVNREETEGMWIKYNQGADYMPLWESLQGKNTGWCTAGEEICKSHISIGDFYVYYTKDEEGMYTNPRIAIRMEGHNKIAEVRGVAKEQHLEANMIAIAEKKLDDFPDKEHYKKKVHDMKLLTLLDKKTELGEELSSDELEFLYQINKKIEGFGYIDDPRIEEIQARRNTKKDLAKLFNCKEENVGTKKRDLFTSEIVVFYGNLNMDDVDTKCLTSLQIICGNMDYNNCMGIDCLQNLEMVTGNVSCYKLKFSNGLEKLRRIGGNASFTNLEYADGLINLQEIGGHAHFDRLPKAKGLNNLIRIGKAADFGFLNNAEGLNKLEYIGDFANFDSLYCGDGLDNLRIIGGFANFRNMVYIRSYGNAKGLNKLQSIGGYALFENLISSQGLNNLLIVGGNLIVSFLRDYSGFSNLVSVNGNDANIFFENHGIRK